MDVNLELARTRLTVEHFAENLPLEEAERFYRFLNEKCAFLNRRIAREKLAIAKNSASKVGYGTNGNGSRVTV